jgi:hypothetical protein
MNNSYRQPSYASSQPLAPGPQSTYRPQSGGGPYGLPYQHGYSQGQRPYMFGGPHGPTYRGDSGVPQQSQIFNAVFGGMNQNPFYGDPFRQQQMIQQMRQSQAQQMMNSPQYQLRRFLIS